jgi:hypothetical protein
MKVQAELARICHETDDGGLLGWVHLAPPELLEHYDAILALDIGGTNVRCGIVRTRRKRAPDLSKAKVVRREKWRHRDDGPNRRALVARLAEMLEEQVRYCKKKGIRLAPFVGIARTARSRAARRTCPATGPASISTCPPRSRRRSPPSAACRRWC